MSTSSNKQQKKGKDGMGKAGKGKEMVKDWCGASCVCGRVSTSKLCMDKLCCMHVCVHVCMDGWMYGCIYICMVGPQARLFFPRAERRHGHDED